MKKNLLLLLLCLFCSVNLCNAKAKSTFTVFQLNLWHGGAKVPNGDQGIIDVLDQMDADVVFLCEVRDGKRFIPHVIEELNKRGKHYYGETFDLAIGILSKFKPDSMTKCCIVPGDDSRAMVKMTTTIEGQPVSFYSCHLDYRNYECYMPRGYSGTSWKKIDNPITDESEVLKANRLSFRDESIRTFVQEVQTDIKQGRPVIMGGDFNEPSHLDWQADTKNLWDHNGAVIHWDCSMMLHEAGFKDSYREKYPNPVRYPGFTFPAGNKLAEEAKLEKLAWSLGIFLFLPIIFLFLPHNNKQKTFNLQCKLTLHVVRSYRVSSALRLWLMLSFMPLILEVSTFLPKNAKRIS